MPSTKPVVMRIISIRDLLLPKLTKALIEQLKSESGKEDIIRDLEEELEIFKDDPDRIKSDPESLIMQMVQPDIDEYRERH